VRCANCSATWFVSTSDAEALPSVDEIALQEDLKSDVVTALTDPAERQGAADVSSIKTPTPTVESGATAAVGADVLLRDQTDALRLRRRKRTIRLIWILTALIAIAAIITAYLNRQDIVNRQPEMASLYKAFGIEVRAGGLTIEPPIAKTALVEGRPIIRVEGAVRNLSQDSVDVPLIELTLHDPAGVLLVQWYVEPSESRLPAKGRLPFVTEYADPPQGVTSLRYRLVSS
jgi:hypothetical protein